MPSSVSRPPSPDRAACLAHEPAGEVGRDGRGDEDDDRSRYGGRRSLHVQRLAAAGAVAQREPDAADESGQREEFADEAFAPAVEHGDGQCEPDDDVENVHWYAERVIVWDKDSASRAQNQIYLVLPRRRLSKREALPSAKCAKARAEPNLFGFCRGAAYLSGRLVLRKVCKPSAEPNLFGFCRSAAYLSGGSSSAKCANRAQNQIYLDSAEAPPV